jgi:hypothetical protein
MATRNVKKEYESEWSEAIEWIQGRHEEGIIDPALIVDEYNRVHMERFLKRPNFQDYYFDQEGIPKTSNMVLVVNKEEYILSSESEFYTRIMNELIMFIMAHAGKFTDIVELGSGFGRNIFLLQRELASRNLHNVRFHACEYTESGRRATTLLKEKNKGPEVTVHTFDYYNPDLSFLDNAKGVLFFTVLSVEQIPQLPEKLFDRMIQRAGNCYCIHFEPVGWQYEPECKKFRDRYDSIEGKVLNIFGILRWKCLRFLDKTIGTHLATGVRSISLDDVGVGKSEKVSLNAAKWSALMQYNKNLVDVLNIKKNKKEIEITKVLKNNVSVNPFNPITIISWESTKSI